MSHVKPTTQARTDRRTPPAACFEIAQVFSLLAFVAALLLWSSGTWLPRLALATGVALVLLQFAFVWPHRNGGHRPKAVHRQAQASKSPRHPEGPFKLTVKSRHALAATTMPVDVLGTIDEFFVDVSFASAEELRAAFDGKLDEETVGSWLDTILLHAQVEKTPPPVPTVPEPEIRQALSPLRG